MFNKSNLTEGGMMQENCIDLFGTEKENYLYFSL